MRKMNELGMTLIEIMIVIAIVAGLMAVLATNVMASWEKARYNQGEIGVRNIVSAVQKYELDCNKPPSADAGLEALLVKPSKEECANWGPEPYLTKKQLSDPYGHSYLYQLEDGSPSVVFLGKNGKVGGSGYDRDISSIEDRAVQSD